MCSLFKIAQLSTKEREVALRSRIVRARPSLPAHVTLTPNYHYLNSALLAVELADHMCLTIDLRYYQAAYDDLDFMCWQLAVLLRSGKVI